MKKCNPASKHERHNEANNEANHDLTEAARLLASSDTLIEIRGDEQPGRANYGAITVPQDSLERLNELGVCRQVNRRQYIDVSKLVVNGFKRATQDLALFYAGYDLLTRLNPKLESPWGYLPVVTLALATAAEDILYHAHKHYPGLPALSHRNHEGVEMAKEWVDGGFAASIYFTGGEEVSAARVTGAAVGGMSLASVSTGLNLLHHYGSRCINNKSFLFNAARTIFYSGNMFAVAAGATELLLAFMSNIDVDGKSIGITEKTSNISQNVVGAVSGLLTLISLVNGCEKPQKVIETLCASSVYMTMLTTILFDAYTSAEKSDSISNAYGYSVIAGAVISAVAYVSKDLYDIKNAEPATPLSMDDFIPIQDTGEYDRELNTAVDEFIDLDVSASEDEGPDVAGSQEQVDADSASEGDDILSEMDFFVLMDAASEPLPPLKVTSQLQHSRYAGTLFANSTVPSVNLDADPPLAEAPPTRLSARF